MTTDPNTATPPQIRYITSLMTERDTGFNAEATQTVIDHLPEMSKQAASDLISALKDKPYKASGDAPKASKDDNYGIPSADALPTGRYAIDNADGELTFYRVWRGTKNPDYVKVYLLHGPDESEIPFSKGMVTILKSIAEDAAGAAIRYGHEIGACSVCAKRLTNRVSRALGIGPICGGHFYGEEFKSVVHGAREQIKAQGLDPDGNVEEDEVVERYDVRADFEAPVDVNRYAAISRVGLPADNPHATEQGNAPTGVSAAETLAFIKHERSNDLWTTIKDRMDTMSTEEIESIIALMSREVEKREFAKREQEQERAAYTRKMQDQSFLAR